MINKPIRDNWEILLNLFNSLKEKFSSDVTVYKYVQILKKDIDIIFNIVKQQRLFNVGSLNLNKELFAISNKLEGIDYALRSGDLPEARALSLIQEIKPVIDNAITELLIKTDKQILNSIVFDDEHTKSINTVKYNKLTKVMRNTIKNLDDLSIVHNIDNSSSKDIINISIIKEKNKIDMQDMKKALELTPKPFYILGPVIINNTVDLNKLKELNIDHDIVYFPGIRFGLSRKEETKRFTIIRNQFLLVFCNKFYLKLNGISIKDKIIRENKNFDIPEAIKSISMEKGTHFIQVSNILITNSNFPNIKFCWVMPENLHRKISLGSSFLELPF